MIARTVRDDAASQLIRRQLVDRIDRPPYLERSCFLQVLALKKNFAANLLIDRIVGSNRCSMNSVHQSFLGSTGIGEVGRNKRLGIWHEAMEQVILG